LIAALLLLLLGSAVAQFVGDMVKNAAESAGIDFAPSLGRAVSALLLFIVGVMAITQLQIDTEMLRLVTSFVLAAGAIAFGISFGLGARDITRNILAGFYARKILQVGKKLQIGDQEGTLRAITATHTVLQRDDQSVNVSNTTFLDRVTRQ
jgi:small-conductance mechanosensitive channel